MGGGATANRPLHGGDCHRSRNLMDGPRYGVDALVANRTTPKAPPSAPPRDNVPGGAAQQRTGHCTSGDCHRSRNLMDGPRYDVDACLTGRSRCALIQKINFPCFRGRGDKHPLRDVTRGQLDVHIQGPVSLRPDMGRACIIRVVAFENDEPVIGTPTCTAIDNRTGLTLPLRPPLCTHFGPVMYPRGFQHFRWRYCQNDGEPLDATVTVTLPQATLTSATPPQLPCKKLEIRDMTASKLALP
jgi:hypothetical protein